MAAVYGKLKEFQLLAESMKSYLVRVSLYFMGNSVPEEKQVPILLRSIGSMTCTLLTDLLALMLWLKVYGGNLCYSEAAFQPQ